MQTPTPELPEKAQTVSLEEALQSLSLLQSVVDSLPQAISWKDHNSVFLGCNQAFVRAIGLNHPSEIIGKHESEVPGTNEEPKLKTQTIPLQNANGNSTGIVSITEDITKLTRSNPANKASSESTNGVINSTPDPIFVNDSDRNLEQRLQERIAELEQTNQNLQRLLEERSQTEIALKESEARLRALVNNLPFGFWASDLQSRHTMQNAESIQQWGNLIGKRPQDLNLPPNVLETWLENNARVLAGEVLRFEKCYEKEGKTWICYTTLAPVWNGTEIRGLLGVDIDVTEQKLTEAAIRENEERLRLVLESMPVMMDAFDEAGNIIVWNSECERVTGYSAAEIIGNPKALELLYPDPDYRARMLEEWARLGNNFRNWEWEIGCKGGGTKTVLWSNLSEKFPIPGWATWGFAIDISDRKRVENERRQAEEALRQSEQQLRKKAQELEETLRELRLTQAQVIQSEKMSSLGQLVAGVAHEINNPVNFIYGNLSHASEYTQDLLNLIQLYRQHYPNSTAVIQAAADEVDLDFLMEDLPKLLSSMRVGADRIQKIVRSLRSFSRMDESEIKLVDIHEGIDSTLMILQNRLKAKGSHPEIEVIKRYGNLPMVECYAGQLNQVFMNILANAIDALEESFELRVKSSELDKSASSPTITIRTEALESNFVRIAIADNGHGMSEAQRQRLFDPFFTTKPIGKGTGLGLSISYQVVVERHHGQISCNSALGQGAEFLIEIPVYQPR